MFNGWLRCGFTAVLLAVVLIFGCDSRSSGSGTKADLHQAIKARTEAALLQQEAERIPGDVLEAMRKVMVKAEAKQAEGNILLTKDRYDEALTAFDESASLYQKVVDGRKVLEKLDQVRSETAAARLLAESGAAADQLKAAEQMEVNAEGYLQAGEFDAAMAELEKARKAYDSLLPAEGPATLEQAVAARTAMLAAKEQIKTLPGELRQPQFDPSLPLEVRRMLQQRRGRESGSETKVKPGSFLDLLTRASAAESAAGQSLEQRRYGPAKNLFAAAEKSYREALVIQTRREQVAAGRQSVIDNMKLADGAFKTSARPASFERGKQALADADQSISSEDFDAAKAQLATAAEHFAAAKQEAELHNALAAAQQAWSAVLAGVDVDLLVQYEAEGFASAKAKSADAEAKAAAGQLQPATALFVQATADLKGAVAAAVTKQNLARAEPIIARLEQAVAAGRKFAAEGNMVELQSLIPSDPRLAALRRRVAELPWPKGDSLDLGGGVTLDLILIRPGTFVMGSEERGPNEKPVHKVTISRPFYMGKFEVTQRQWEAVMGNNPSKFKGADNPVDSVSWNDATEFCAKLAQKTGKRVVLPTEAQWEYACRAETTTDFYTGDGNQALADAGWYEANSGGKTQPVGKKKPNAWGLHDMHGNVWEWCADRYGTYGADESTDPKGPASGNSRVLRGGSWNNDAQFCRSAYRNGYAPDLRNYGFGFRVSLDLSE
ncbi:MAG: Hercynine oxygenase [Myxococcota bacterium]|nr:Hercynine oxygenase [Myxococcota bacterium]